MNAGILAILERIYNCPLMVTPEKLAVICSVLQARYGLELSTAPPDVNAALQEHAAAPIRMGRTDAGYYLTPSGSAVVPVAGSLAHRRGGMIAPDSGLMSYDGIRNMFHAAMADPAAKEIILDVNSHGGEVHGVFDLADEIYKARDVKPSMAVINEVGASAAYLLASACNIVVMPQNGRAGSIGVVMRHVDMSQLNAKEGVTVTYIYAGAKKVQGHPDAPLSDGDVADLQSSVNGVYEQFVAAVARNRGMTPDAVRGTEAAVFRGASAVGVGLTDDTMPAGDAYAAGISGVRAILAGKIRARG